MNYKLQDRSLLIHGRVIPNFPVVNAVDHNGVIIVLRDWSDNPGANQSNVFGLDQSGQLMWQIKNPNPDSLQHATGIGVIEGRLRVYFWGGFEMPT